MARGSRLDLTRLTVLALLLHGPRHPYELHRLVLETHKDYITGLPRSLYHAVDRLARDELIVPVETTREGRRPERTVYEITDEGRAELVARFRRLLEEPGSAPLPVLVSLLAVLSPRDAERALRSRAGVLEGQITGIDRVWEGLQATGLPRLLVLELECDRALRRAELDWVRGVAAELASGELTWTGGVPETALPDVWDGQAAEGTDEQPDREGGAARGRR